MTKYNHFNNANNFCVITSYEFSDIVSYLTSKVISPSNVLPIMKGFESKEYKEKENYYTVKQDEAWEYFKAQYSVSIQTKRVRDMDDLLHSAKDYVDRHSDR